MGRKAFLTDNESAFKFELNFDDFIYDFVKETSCELIIMSFMIAVKTVIPAI